MDHHDEDASALGRQTHAPADGQVEPGVEGGAKAPVLDRTGRRPLLKVALGGAVAVGALGTASRLAWQEGDDGRGTLELSSDDGSDVGTLHLRLKGDLLEKVGPQRWRSPKLATTVHSMAAFTWSDASQHPHIEVRARQKGAWQAWYSARRIVDVPDPGSEPTSGLVGTELVWAGSSDGVQVRVRGERPSDLTLVLLHPAQRTADLLTTGAEGELLARRRADEVTATPGKAPMPKLFSRQDWGADESWRSGSPQYCKTIQQTHVHHTVNSNTYSQSDVPALIRGMYRYHTGTLGWSDIGYNFLVDRFGSAWVGRYGGPSKPVRGAHTLGFNATSTGISCIGNFETGQPTDKMLSAIAGIAAWKLDMYGRNPLGKATVTSEGSDLFPPGRVVTLPVIDGHRDTNQTACPGQHVYDDLGVVRKRTAAIVDEAHQGSLPQVKAPRASSISGDPLVGSTLKVTKGSFSPSDATTSLAWLRDGDVISGATAASYAVTRADLGHQLAVRVRAAKSGFETLDEVVHVIGTVRAASEVTVDTAQAAARVVTATARVTAPTTNPPVGQVLFTLDGRKRLADVVGGTATARWNKVGSGSHDVVADYQGTTDLLPSRATTTHTS